MKALIIAMLLTASPPAPIATASATCESFTIHVENLVPGDRVFANQGSNPPYHVAVNEAAGTADAVLAASMNPWYYADVLVQRDGQLISLYRALVDCQTPPMILEPVVAVAEPPVPPSFEVSVLFPGLELAPPW
jgi:hypothetical protein